jgi:hypothetical protein
VRCRAHCNCKPPWCVCRALHAARNGTAKLLLCSLCTQMQTVHIEVSCQQAAGCEHLSVPVWVCCMVRPGSRRAHPASRSMQLSATAGPRHQQQQQREFDSDRSPYAGTTAALLHPERWLIMKTASNRSETIPVRLVAELKLSPLKQHSSSGALLCLWQRGSPDLSHGTSRRILLNQRLRGSYQLEGISAC